MQVKIIMKKNCPSILKKQQLNHSEWEHIVDEVTRMYKLSPEEKQLLSGNATAIKIARIPFEESIEDAEATAITQMCFYIENMSNFKMKASSFSVNNQNNNEKNTNLLNISSYSELSKRDAEWLIAILKGQQYKTIAATYEISLGAVKNRLSCIFKILGLKNKRDFFNKYSDYEIVYKIETV